jgi:RHS repeat-associated protein
VAMIDAVRLNDLLVENGGFETPAVGPNMVTNPPGATWTFEGSAGIAGNSEGNPPAPNGVQAGFVQEGGRIKQTVTLGADTYTLTCKLAQRPGNKLQQSVRVTLQRVGPGSAKVQRFVWNGNVLAEERDNTGSTVVKRFFAQGEQRRNEKLGTMEAFYYTRDHLGSVREVTDASGELRARYDYDVWGNSVTVNGDMSLDFGYTGQYFHALSGLNLFLYRPYNPPLGRWLSRDPIGEAGGLNLYGYVENNPVNLTDPLGLLVEVYYEGIGSGGGGRTAFKHLQST